MYFYLGITVRDKTLTLRKFTENSRAAFVSVGPDCNKQMQLDQT